MEHFHLGRICYMTQAANMRTMLHIFVLISLLWVITARPTDYSRNHTKILQARGCEWIESKEGWHTYECDEHLPTLDEIVAHMRNPAEEGKADDEHASVFYTNLRDPDINVDPGGNPNYLFSWMFGWLRAQGLTAEDTYWSMDATNGVCE